MELSGSISCPFILSTPLNLHLKEVTSFQLHLSPKVRGFHPGLVTNLTNLFFRITAFGLGISVYNNLCSEFLKFFEQSFREALLKI